MVGSELGLDDPARRTRALESELVLELLVRDTELGSVLELVVGGKLLGLVLELVASGTEPVLVPVSVGKLGPDWCRGRTSLPKKM